MSATNSIGHKSLIWVMWTVL